MTRERTDGGTLAWKLSGLDGMLGPQNLPFFIQWDVEDHDHPAAMPVDHPAGPQGMSHVEVGPVPGMTDLLAGVPGLTIEQGAPGVHSVTVATADGPLVLSRS